MTVSNYLLQQGVKFFSDTAFLLVSTKYVNRGTSNHGWELKCYMCSHRKKYWYFYSNL